MLNAILQMTTDKIHAPENPSGSASELPAISSFSGVDGCTCIIGVGTAASRCVTRMAADRADSTLFHIAIDIAGQQSIDQVHSGLVRISLTDRDLHAVSADGSAGESVESLQHPMLERFKGLMRRFRAVYLIGFLGRPSGSGLARLMGEAAAAINVPVYGFVSTPIAMEGSARMSLAERAIEELSDRLDRLTVLPAQPCFTSMDPRPRTPADFFPILSDRFQLLARLLQDLMAGPQFLPVTLDEFESLLQASESSHPLLLTATAEGEDGFSRLLRDLKDDPLLGEWLSSHSATDVFVHCRGGSLLTCQHVDLVVESVSRIFPGSEMIAGATEHSSEGSDGSSFFVAVLAVDRTSAGESITGKTQESREAAAPVPQNRVASTAGMTAGAVPFVQNRMTDADMEADHGEGLGVDPGMRDSVMFPYESQTEQNRADNPIPEPDFSGIDEDTWIAPPPEIDEELARRIIQQKRRSGRKKEARKISHLQQQLPLAIISRGRFENTEENIYQGQDLDIPTFIRMGVDVR